LNYVEALASRIEREIPEAALPAGENTRQLFLAYALLALAKGADVTPKDVHDAWSTWMTGLGEDHESIVPYAELPRDTQHLDDPFVKAIQRVAADL
jgi:hypothetical protein